MSLRYLSYSEDAATDNWDIFSSFVYFNKCDQQNKNTQKNGS